MRLWSVHPKYLDSQGLTALWREGLLAQAVLRGRTLGYRAHPQLDRFRASGRPLGLIATYLQAVWKEGRRRGYAYDRDRILGRPAPMTLEVPRGQVEWEWAHLLGKLRRRAPSLHAKWRGIARPQVHPLFRRIRGGLAPWERGTTDSSAKRRPPVRQTGFATSPPAIAPRAV